MKLSKRLELVASFVPEGSRIADVGTDHGYIPIELVKRGLCPSGIAMDIGKGPLERAREHIREQGLEEKIESRLSDGLSALKPGEADTVVIAGMGGELVIHILDAGRHMWESVKEFVLSPQSELDKVRKYLEENGFAIQKEAMVVDEGKYYTVMLVKRGVM
ncbi:MAG: class I SAM-dependent methyltransferase, partial [Lachnospiraceae bacterium]|nr:class I SAM-dependent methyltransferase [Lachnospiraceae bacterium]